MAAEGGQEEFGKRTWSTILSSTVLYGALSSQTPPPHLPQPPTHSTQKKGLGSRAEAGATADAQSRRKQQQLQSFPDVS